MEALPVRGCSKTFVLCLWMYLKSRHLFRKHHRNPSHCKVSPGTMLSEIITTLSGNPSHLLAAIFPSKNALSKATAQSWHIYVGKINEKLTGCSTPLGFSASLPRNTLTSGCRFVVAFLGVLRHVRHQFVHIHLLSCYLAPSSKLPFTADIRGHPAAAEHFRRHPAGRLYSMPDGRTNATETILTVAASNIPIRILIGRYHTYVPCCTITGTCCTLTTSRTYTCPHPIDLNMGFSVAGETRHSQARQRTAEHCYVQASFQRLHVASSFLTILRPWRHFFMDLG
jgi:hypothetical protein